MWAIRIAVIVCIVGSWQYVAVKELINPVFSGTPSKIAVEFWDVITGSVLTVDLPTTLIETLLGFASGSVVGFIAGAILTQLPILRRALGPILTALNSLPRVALAPLFIIWFGLGSMSKVALSFSLVVFIMLLNTMAGLIDSDRDVLLLARSLGSRGLRRIVYFVLPGAIPVLAAGLELGLIYSFLGAVVGELMGGYSGLGVVLAGDANTFAIDHFFAVLLLLLIVSSVLTALLRAGEHRVLRWHRIETRGSAAR
jgi:NitT/TauT family transport system permease protein